MLILGEFSLSLSLRFLFSPVPSLFPPGRLQLCRQTLTVIYKLTWLCFSTLRGRLTKPPLHSGCFLCSPLDTSFSGRCSVSCLVYQPAARECPYLFFFFFLRCGRARSTPPVSDPHFFFLFSHLIHNNSHTVFLLYLFSFFSPSPGFCYVSFCFLLHRRPHPARVLSYDMKKNHSYCHWSLHAWTGNRFSSKWLIYLSVRECFFYPPQQDCC